MRSDYLQIVSFEDGIKILGLFLLIILSQSMAEQANVKQQMQNLLEQFNKIDHKKQGSIKLSEAVRLIKQVCNLTALNEEVISKVIFNVERQVSFDQFLALLYQAELTHGLTKNALNYNMVQFLKLLEDYRKKCEESCLYLEAQKAHQKIMEVKDKEMRRHKQNLLSQQKEKVISVNSLQHSRLIEFNGAWNEYMDKYENAAMTSLEKLKARHLREMEEEEVRIKNYLESYLKPSKRVIDLRSKEKSLVKQRDYLQAEKIKNIASKLQQKERESKTNQIAERIKKRKQVLQKHQEISLLAHLKRIEKDRNEQLKQRQVDSQKMLIKLKNIQNDLVQKQSVEIRQTLENLRQTMCLTSGKLFMSRQVAEHRSAEKIHDTIMQQKPKDKKQKQFKIRVNSFHRTKMDQSLYDP